MTEQELFLQALDVAGGSAREQFLDQACKGDAKLRDRVAALLQAHEAPSDFLRAPAFDTPTTNMPVITEGPGSAVGPYRLLQKIGEGGFGVVYMAEQTEPVRRKVALKIIKPGMDTKEVIARFESERQALALMDHPNIARVLDAGATESGRPYFVMELVKGVPITEFCDKNKLSVQDRLALFVPVCLAVQHAHHKGVIHRDIKPSNVMVTLHDGRPVPKVIDFGVAKATSQQLTQRTLFTAFGQMIGTPVYMSPEQAEMSGLDIDTRSDIYSLGVLLYELLTGTTPIEQKKLREAGLIEMQRLIRDVEAPRPSTRLSTLHEEASIICSNRGTDPKRLGDLLKGDVDWIVMKALEKDRQRRYDTPTSFADDIQRYLKHEAIHARPPSTAYRCRKFIQRNKGLAFGIGAVAGTLLLGAIVSSVFAFQAIAEGRRAREAEAQALVSLKNEQQAKTAAEAEKLQAEKDRDRAVAAEKLAETRLQETESARMSEREQRELAERRQAEADALRQEAERQREAANKLNVQLTQSNDEQRRAIYATEMNLVRIAAERGNLARMREILMDQLPIDGKEDLRGFEWSYWYNYLNKARVLLKVDNFRYGQPDSAVAIIPGGELVAVTRGSQTEIRDIATGKVLGVLPEQLQLLVNRTRFSRTGRSVHGRCNALSSFWPQNFTREPLSDHCTVYEPTGEAHRFTFPQRSFSHLSFLNISDDGKRIVVLGNSAEHQSSQPSCRLIVWDIDSQSIVLNQVQSRELNRVTFSPDGSLLAVYLCHGTKRLSNDYRDVAVVIDVATGAERGVAQHNDDLDSVYWLPDQRRLLLSTLSYSGANRMELLTWTIGSPARPHRLSQETMPNWLKGVVSPDGRLIAVTGHTVSNIRLIDTNTGKVVHKLHNEATTIDNLTFSHDGQQLIACSTTGEVLSWDLRLNGDLFALASRPLPQLAYDGYALSQDQELLAIVTATGSVLIRNRAGEETALDLGTAGSARGTSRLVFSTDNRWLAHRFSASSTGTTRSAVALDLYDLSSGRRIWRMKSGVSEFAFTPDNQRMFVQLSTLSWSLLDCRTGEAVAQVAGLDPNQPRWFERLRTTSNGRLIVAYTAQPPRKFQDVGESAAFPPERGFGAMDVMTGEVLYESSLAAFGKGDLSTRRPRLTPSPDGVHLALVQSSANRVEVWNMVSEQLVISVEGTGIVFSPDGSRAAISRAVTFTQVGQNSPLTRIGDVAIWDIIQGQQLCEISLAGNFAEEVRFSPDCLRLLTLHGKTALGSGGAAAQGHLWDAQSGQEILAIPVADTNVYNWDLAFDNTGHRLTSLLFGKSYGTGGGGTGVVYDATPLDVERDAELIARRLVEELSKTTPLPAEIVDAIQDKASLKPRVTELALERARQLPLDVERLAEACLKIGIEPGRPEEDYRRGLNWALALRKQEPQSIRAQAAVGLLQYRLRQTAEALVTLQVANPVDNAVAANSSEYETLRRAALVLTLEAAGEPERAKVVRGEVSQIWGGVAISGSTLRSEFRMLVFETQFSAAEDRGRRFSLGPSGSLGTSGTFPLSNAESRKSFANALFDRCDNNSDGLLVEEEIPTGLQPYFKGFDADHDGAANRAELENFFPIFLRYRISVGRPVEERLKMLGEIVAKAPEFAPALNDRAWILATSPTDQLRNGEQAVIDAQRANQLTEGKVSNYLRTLAAAHAEAGQYAEAVKHQQAALALATEEDDTQQFVARLELYQKGQPYRETDSPIPRPITFTPQFGASRTLTPGASTVTRHAPALLAPAHLARCRTIPGWGCAWSPDGQKLVRNLNLKLQRESHLEIIDLETGATTVLCTGGVDPIWSRVPGGPIAFKKVPEDKEHNALHDELWLIESDGSNLRNLGPGGFPSWTDENRLFYRIVAEDKSLQLLAISPTAPQDPLSRHVIEGVYYPTVSRDGTLVAYAASDHLTVKRLATNELLVNLPLTKGERGLVDFSPDGKFIGYGSWDMKYPGVWLVEVATGRKRLLADLYGTMPRWSPDGKYIAVDQRYADEIRLLDVSQFDLSQGLEHVLPLPVKIVATPSNASSAAQDQGAP